MNSKVYSAAVVGVDAFEAEIDMDAGSGPEGRINEVGLPDTAVKEDRDRMPSALSNSALRRLRGRSLSMSLQLRSRKQDRVSICQSAGDVAIERSRTGSRNWISLISVANLLFPVNRLRSEER
jgi:hypothetical protein